MSPLARFIVAVPTEDAHEYAHWKRTMDSMRGVVTIFVDADDLERAWPEFDYIIISGSIVMQRYGYLLSARNEPSIVNHNGITFVTTPVIDFDSLPPPWNRYAQEFREELDARTLLLDPRFAEFQWEVIYIKLYDLADTTSAAVSILLSSAHCGYTARELNTPAISEAIKRQTEKFIAKMEGAGFRFASTP